MCLLGGGRCLWEGLWAAGGALVTGLAWLLTVIFVNQFRKGVGAHGALLHRPYF